MPLKFETQLDDSKFAAGLKNMAREAAGFNSRLEESSKTSAKNFGYLAAGAAAAAYGIASLVKGSLDFASSLRDSIDSTDMSAEAYQRLSFSFAQSGASQEDFTRGSQNLTVKMQEARDGNEKTIASFAKLGISLDDLNAPTSEVLAMIADGTKNAGNRSEALAASLDLLGRAGKKMQAGLKEGADGLTALSAGLKTLSEDELARLDAMGDKLDLYVKRAKAHLAESIFIITGGLRGFDQTNKEVAKPAKAADDIAARRAHERRLEQKALQERNEIRAAADAEWARHDSAISKTAEEGEVKSYKARAEAFKQADKEKADAKTAKEKEAADNHERWLKYEQQQEAAHTRFIFDEYDKRVERGKDASGAIAKAVSDATENAFKQALDEAKGKAGEARDAQQQAQNKLERDTGAAVRAGLQTPQERRAEAMAAKREAREERRLKAIIDEPWRKIGGKTGDAERAKQLQADRRGVIAANNAVTLAETSVKALTDAIEKLLLK